MPPSSTPVTTSGSRSAYLGSADRSATWTTSLGPRPCGQRRMSDVVGVRADDAQGVAGGVLCAAAIRKTSPSRRYMFPNLASQMRIAFASMVSNTGSNSPGRRRDDLQHLRGRGLLLQRLGQLARARLHLVEQPHVLDSDHRLVGEGLDQLDLLVGERTHALAMQTITPIGFPSRRSGTPSRYENRQASGPRGMCIRDQQNIVI